jgi:hypothetical protein
MSSEELKNTIQIFSKIRPENLKNLKKMYYGTCHASTKFSPPFFFLPLIYKLQATSAPWAWALGFCHGLGFQRRTTGRGQGPGALQCHVMTAANSVAVAYKQMQPLSI